MSEPDPIAGGKFDRPPGPTEELVATTRHTGRRVALTFDDGPDPHYTPRILDLLAAHGITATFCLIGRNARRHPALVERIAAAGHVLANHTMTHPDLTKLTPEEIHAELSAANDALRDAVPDAPPRFFRAPFGGWTTMVRVTAMDLGLQPLDWSVNPCDWANPGMDRIVGAVERDLKPGGVVLLHDSAHDIDGDTNRGQTVAAVDTLIPRLLAQGYSFDVPALPVERDS